MALAVGDKVGPYEIVAPLGKGGMGEVWRARDTRLDRDVAIKISAEQFTERFEREVRAVAALNHPNICHLYDVGPHYLVMEFVDGKPPRGPMPPEDAVRMAIQIAGAMEEAHGKRILHRDLKPGNILVTTRGVVKLLDFGLAKSLDDGDPNITKTIEGSVLGTPAYMSPEQAEGKPVDDRSDIFSFGAVLYELISGSRAFGGRSMAQVLKAILQDEPRPPECPEALRRIVSRCLEKQPDQRFHRSRRSAALDRRFAIRQHERGQGKRILQRRSG